MRHHSLLLKILKTDLYRSGKTDRYTGSSHRRVAMTLAYPPIAPQTRPELGEGPLCPRGAEAFKDITPLASRSTQGYVQRIC